MHIQLIILDTMPTGNKLRILLKKTIQQQIKWNDLIVSSVPQPGTTIVFAGDFYLVKHVMEFPSGGFNAKTFIFAVLL